MPKYCTVPKVFGFRGWFEKRFKHLCIEHDGHYVRKDASQKRADQIMFAGMIKAGYVWFGLVVYVFLRLFGWLYYRDVIK